MQSEHSCMRTCRADISRTLDFTLVMCAAPATGAQINKELVVLVMVSVARGYGMGVRSMRLLWISARERGDEGGIKVGEGMRCAGDWEVIIVVVMVGDWVADDVGL